VTRGCLLAIAFVVAFWIAVALFVASALAAPSSGSLPFPADASQSGASHGTSQLLPRVTVALDATVAGAGAEDRSPASDAPLSGVATWYSWHRHEAAAGPRLRAWLGKGWRHTRVVVCAKACVVVRLTDWCACKGERIVDLDSRSFRALAPLSQGIVRVTVSRLPVGPATDR
jgi:hypothetical protein